MPRAAQIPFTHVRLGRLVAPTAVSAGVSRKPLEIQVGGWVEGVKREIDRNRPTRREWNTQLGGYAALHGASQRQSAQNTPTHIQSLALLHPSSGDGPPILAGVDAAQGLLIHRLNDESGGGGSSSSTSPSHFPFRGGDRFGCGEFVGFGWAGLAADPSHPGHVATVGEFCLCVLTGIHRLCVN